MTDMAYNGEWHGESTTLHDRIRDYMWSHCNAGRTNQIAAELGVTVPAVCQAMRIMLETGEVERVGRGLYRINGRRNMMRGNDSACHRAINIDSGKSV